MIFSSRKYSCSSCDSTSVNRNYIGSSISSCNSSSLTVVAEIDIIIVIVLKEIINIYFILLYSHH